MSNALFSAAKEIQLDSISVSAADIETASSNDAVEQVVSTLKSKNVLSAPIVDDAGKLVGLLDIADLVSFLVHNVCGTDDVEMSERNMALRSAQELMLLSPRDVLTPLDPNEPATLAVHLFATGIHRAPLTDSDDKLVGLVTQFDLAAKFAIAMKEGAAAALGDKSIAELGVGLFDPVSIADSTSVGDALGTLDAWQVSALAVVDASGKLVGNFSVTNVINLWKAHGTVAEGLNKTVREYLEEYSKASLEPQTCTRETALSAAVDKMVEKKIHRLWVVDDNLKPVGVVSLTDVFKVARDADDGAAEAAAGAHFKAAAAAGTTEFGTSVRAAGDHSAVSLNEAGDAVVMLKKADDALSQWKVEHVDAAHIKLQQGGKYLTADAKHTVGLGESGADAVFQLVESDTGFVALRSAHGGFLEPHGTKLECKASNKKRPTKRQLFKMSGAFGKKN